MKNKKPVWNFLAVAFLIIYALLQIRRWDAFPQHFDIYYHLLTAWGFIKAGGYSAWDFWQYAPIGRPHAYPPLFHVILAMLMKAGADKIFLARIFSVVIPPVFMFVLWNFIRKQFSSLLALLCLVTISSSFSFYAGLVNHLPSTIALIFGILAIGQYMNKKFSRTAILLTLSFYTHISSACFITIGLFIYSLWQSDNRPRALQALIIAILASLPVITQQIAAARLLPLSVVKENSLCEFKTLDYLLAAVGVVILLRSKGKGRLFLAIFIASFIFSPYAFRFFSAEGFLAIALLSAITLYAICESFMKRSFKYIMTAIIIFILILSPTIAMGQAKIWSPVYRVYLFDSAIMDMIFSGAKDRMIAGNIWFDKYYNFAAKMIRENSSWDDIIYSPDDVIGLCLAVASERATANYLLPEVQARRAMDPYAVSKIIVLLKYHDQESVKKLVQKYQLKFLGKNEIFYIYKNDAATAKMEVRKAAIHFL